LGVGLRVPRVRVAVYLDVVALRADAVDEAPGQSLNVQAIVFHLLARHLRVRGRLDVQVLGLYRLGVWGLGFRV